MTEIIKSITAATGQVPIPSVTASLLDKVLFFYPGITLDAMSDKTINIHDPENRKGLPEYIKARQADLWELITKQ